MRGAKKHLVSPPGVQLAQDLLNEREFTDKANITFLMESDPLVRERRDEALSRAGRRGTAGTGLSEADTRAGSAASPSRASQRQC